MNRYGCHLLIGTPGRLLDILTDPSSGVSAPNLHTLVLDEADRLLDQGFQESIQEIQGLLPDRRSVDRQTLLYSATVPKEVMNMVNETLKPNYKLIRTVKQGEAPTHERVPQMRVVTAGVQNMLPALLELCKREVSAVIPPGSTKAPFKAIVYLNSTANVSLAASIFRNLRESQGPNVGGHPLGSIRTIEIHSKLTQQGRTYASESFRKAKSAILFSSDVTARGMDFPGVTHIIQLGIPPSEETYVHRIGRTARGNSAGESWIILADFEDKMARQRLRNLPIRRDNSLATAKVDMTKEVELPANVAENLTQVSEATLLVDRETKVKAYHAFLGAYSSLRDRQRLVDSLSDWVKYGWGWKEPPTISPILVQKLGFQHVTGLNIGRPERTRSEGESTRLRDSNRSGGEGYNKGGQFGSRGRSPRVGRGLLEDREFGRLSNRGSFLSESREFGSKGRGGYSSGGRGGPDRDRYRNQDRRGGK
jgi:ATP-dependent RNA helicase MSS116, mitochondrial